MTKRNNILNKKCIIIRYYCVSHNLNTKNKKLLLKNRSFNGQIEFYCIKEAFFTTCNHNEICHGKNPKQYDTFGEIQKNVYEFADFQNELINYLNIHHIHPLISFSVFKKIATKHFFNNECEFKKKLLLIYFVRIFIIV